MPRTGSVIGPANAAHGTAGRAARALPGLGAVAAVTLLGFAAARAAPAVSVLIAAMLAGALLAPLCRRAPATGPGVALAGRTSLRAGIVLLGLSVSIGDLAGLGLAGLAIAAGTLVATLAATRLLAPALRVEAGLATLIGAGSAICGASAIAAMQPLTRARDEDVSYAVATVALFGTAAMLLVPLAGPLLGLDARATGLWAGASIHEVAQVAGAGAAVSPVALKIATLTKLARVALLAPAVAATGRSRGSARGAVPPFLLGFAACVVGRSLLPLPGALLAAAALAATALLAAGLAALGLQLRPADLRAAGPRPLVLGLGASLTASGVALALVLLLG